MTSKRVSGPYTLYLRMLDYQWYKRDEQPTLTAAWIYAAEQNNIDEVTGVAVIDRDGQLVTWFGAAMRKYMLQPIIKPTGDRE